MAMKTSKPPSAAPISPAEAAALFAPWRDIPAIVLAVSGGPDSTALLWLAARWRKRLRRGPDLLAVTVDHGLRAESLREARDVKRLADRLGIAHRVLRWRGEKPDKGLPAAAREARYRLLAEAARKHGAAHVVTAHTGDDQAETFLMRVSRGSGIAGLAAMAARGPLPFADAPRGKAAPQLLRPFLALPKARLLATLEAAGVAFADDPTNRDANYTRPRWRVLMPLIAKEGIDTPALLRLSSRLARANAALESVVDAAARSMVQIDRGGAWIEVAREPFITLPDEVALRLLGRAIGLMGHEGPVELGKLEVLFEDFHAAQDEDPPRGWKRTLAGATVAVTRDVIRIAPAPPRRSKMR